jgi:hypothetical protein
MAYGEPRMTNDIEFRDEVQDAVQSYYNQKQTP